MRKLRLPVRCLVSVCFSHPLARAMSAGHVMLRVEKLSDACTEDVAHLLAIRESFYDLK